VSGGGGSRPVAVAAMTGVITAEINEEDRATMAAAASNELS